MSRSLTLLATAGLAVGLAGIATTAEGAGGIRAAYVEQVIPAKSFYDTMTFQSGFGVVGPGPGSGVLGVSNLVITNSDTSPQQVFIFNPLTTGGACNATGVAGGGTPRLQIFVQAQSTLVIPYPQPMVFNPIGGNTCIAAEVVTTLNGGSVEIDVTGFVN